jgi:hypothetical protein
MLFKRWIFTTIIALTGCAILPAVSAQDFQPTVDFETILDTYFDESNGLISFGDNIVAFAGEGDFIGEVAVLDPDGQVAGRFPYFEEALRDGVFARVRIQGPAEVMLTEPGIYTLVYLVAGKPVTRLPVRLIQTGKGDDPFNPEPTFAFDGYWRTHAHFTQNLYKDEPFLELNFWVGGLDLPEGQRSDQFFIELLRDGNVVAHSKRTLGNIATGHFKRTSASLFHPHEARMEANAELFMLDDLLVDGSYEVRVGRATDGNMIRSYDFEVEGNEIVPLMQTDLTYEPHVDHILPRVLKKNVSVREMIGTIWIRDGGNG